MRRAVIASVALATFLSSAANAAQRRPWEYAREMTPHRVACILERQEPAIKLWLGLLAGSKEEKRAFSRLEASFSICFGSAQEIGWTYHFEADAVRVAMVRYLLERDWNKVPAQVPIRLEQGGWYPDSAIAQRSGQEALLTHQIGKCVALTDWNGARALAAPLVDGASPSRAFAPVISVLPGCVPASVTLKLDRERLRAIIEETVYLASIGSTNA